MIYLHKTNVNFKFQLSAMLVLFIFLKVVSVKVVHSLKICQHTKFHGSKLCGVNFATASVVRTSAILEPLKPRN